MALGTCEKYSLNFFDIIVNVGILELILFFPHLYNVYLVDFNEDKILKYFESSIVK